MLEKIETLKKSLDLSIEQEQFIRSHGTSLLEQSDNFYDQIDRWGRTHCSELLKPAQQLLLKGFYETLVGGDYRGNIYSLVYRQSLYWHRLGVRGTSAALLYNRIRQLVTSYGGSFGYSRLAQALNQVVDLCSILSLEVHELLFRMVHIKHAAEYESQRINQVFSILSRNLPNELLNAYIKHQTWKYQVFCLALGEKLDGMQELFRNTYAKLVISD